MRRPGMLAPGLLGPPSCCWRPAGLWTLGGESPASTAARVPGGLVALDGRGERSYKHFGVLTLFDGRADGSGTQTGASPAMGDQTGKPLVV
jgi:hypothetical protein